MQGEAKLRSNEPQVGAGQPRFFAFVSNEYLKLISAPISFTSEPATM